MDAGLEDRWVSRDFPILLSAARATNSGDQLRVAAVEGDLGFTYSEILSSIDLLRDTGYIAKARFSHAEGGTFSQIRLSEKGLRTVGLWPRQEAAADALIDLLNQAADQVLDEDDAGALKKAGRLLKGVPASVLSDVIAALVRQQTGL